MKASNWYKKSQSSDGTTLQIGRTVYKVTKEDDHYVLEGPRGSLYSTVRNEKDPHLMFLINHKDFTKSAPNIWLSDKDGNLRVV